MMEKVKITVAKGDGIGPEIMDAVLRILDHSGAQIEADYIEVGEKVYLDGFNSGIKPEAWDSIRSHKVLLKAPITTPQGGGYKSLNVTIRKTLGLFANVRPSKAMAPYVRTNFPKLDIVIIRENEEDLYAGIEHWQTADVTQCLKVITVPGTERIIRYAFEYARNNGRKKITCMVKDNIMKVTDGLYSTIFKEIGQEYPEIEQEIKIIDIGAALLADRPEMFDVIVTSNLYGDIISDVVAQVSGSVGLGGSANVGTQVSMFEAIHGSAPDIAGKNIANPSGLLNAAIMMLCHIGQQTYAEKIANAWLKTIEDGIHTGDIYTDGVSKQKVGTKEFADAIIERLGQSPTIFEPIHYPLDAKPIVIPDYVRKVHDKKLVGCDIFVDWQGTDANELAEKLIMASNDKLMLKMISNRGVKVYPGQMEETNITDHWRCRFTCKEASDNATPLNQVRLTNDVIVSQLDGIFKAGIDVIKTENLYYFDEKRGYSLGQGE